MQTVEFNPQLESDAVETFGQDMINEVKMMVDLFDADGVYTIYEDQGEWEKAECVEFLYFN